MKRNALSCYWAWCRGMAAYWRARLLLAFHKPLGRRGEDLAARLLKRQGCRIVARGVRLRGGELDLVAVQGRTIVFVEVKTRRGLGVDESLGESITDQKEQRITRAAYAFLKRHKLLDYPCRFDVITVYWPRGQRPQVRHFPHAFEAAGDERFLY